MDRLHSQALSSQRSAAPVERFLAGFHDARPGCTSRAFDTLAVWVGEQRHASSYDWLAAALPAGARRGIDLACGDGPLLARLSVDHPATEWLGVDLSAGELALARRRLGLATPLLQARAQALPLATGGVDAVACHMALMLMDDADRVLAELRRVLAPAGVLVAVVGARTAGCAVTESLLEALRRFAWAPQWQGLLLSDRRWRDEDGIAGLFSGYEDLRMETAVARRRLTPAQAWDWLAETYDPALLAANERAALREVCLAEMTSRMGEDGRLEQCVALRRISARA